MNGLEARVKGGPGLPCSQGWATKLPSNNSPSVPSPWLSKEY